VEGQLADAPMFTYDARTDAFGSSTKTGYPSESASAAVNRSGTALGYRIGDNIFLQSAPGFSLLHTFAGSQGGITFDGAKDILYLANGITSQLVGYDINTFAERIRINIGQTIPFYTFQFDVGTMEASHDGRYVALITPTNVRLMNTTTRSSVAITIPTLPTGTPTPAPFPTPKPTPAPTPTPPVAGLAVAPAAVGKGGTATFTISLGATTSQDVTVNYSMSGNAGLGADYALSGTLNQVVIPAGQSSANVTLMVTTTKTKGREKATMTIGAGSGYQLPTSGKKSKPNPPKLTVTINNR
jgi:hypothetical protein